MKCIDMCFLATVGSCVVGLLANSGVHTWEICCCQLCARHPWLSFPHSPSKFCQALRLAFHAPLISIGLSRMSGTFLFSGTFVLDDPSSQGPFRSIAFTIQYVPLQCIRRFVETVLRKVTALLHFGKAQSRSFQFKFQILVWALAVDSSWRLDSLGLINF